MCLLSSWSSRLLKIWNNKKKDIISNVTLTLFIINFPYFMMKSDIQLLSSIYSINFSTFPHTCSITDGLIQWLFFQFLHLCFVISNYNNTNISHFLPSNLLRPKHINFRHHFLRFLKHILIISVFRNNTTLAVRLVYLLIFSH